MNKDSVGRLFKQKRGSKLPDGVTSIVVSWGQTRQEEGHDEEEDDEQLPPRGPSTILGLWKHRSRAQDTPRIELIDAGDSMEYLTVADKVTQDMTGRALHVRGGSQMLAINGIPGMTFIPVFSKYARLFTSLSAALHCIDEMLEPRGRTVHVSDSVIREIMHEAFLRHAPETGGREDFAGIIDEILLNPED
jgi:hypothetical protein